MKDYQTNELVHCFNCGSTDKRIAAGMLYECRKCLHGGLIREFPRWKDDWKKSQSVKAELSEAIQQAREQVAREFIAVLNKRDVGGINPEWAMSDKDYQVLKAWYLSGAPPVDEPEWAGARHINPIQGNLKDGE